MNTRTVLAGALLCAALRAVMPGAPADDHLPGVNRRAVIPRADLPNPGPASDGERGGTTDPEAPLPRFRAVELDAKIEVGYGVAAADVDGDRRVDVLLADSHRIAWYRNPTWDKHLIAGNLTAKDHVCLAAADLDGARR